MQLSETLVVPSPNHSIETLPGERRELNLGDIEPAAVVDDAGCPFQINGLCTARERRPLGCRVYYCDPSYQETGNRITEKYLERLKDLAQATGVPWLYAPLHHFLNHPDAGLPPPVAREPQATADLTPEGSRPRSPEARG